MRAHKGATIVMGMLVAIRVYGHLPDKVSQETLLFIDRPHLTLQYRTTFGETLARVRVINADDNKDAKLSQSEKAALLDAHADNVLSNLVLRVDGRELPATCLGGQVGLLADGHLVTRLNFEASLGDLADGRHMLEVEDATFPPAVLGDMRFAVHAGKGSETAKATGTERALEWTFLIAGGLTGDPEIERDIPLGTAGGEAGIEETSRLSRLLRTERLSPLFILFALSLAAGLGALHALSPGHGKAMVAAYLVGSKGCVRDAVILGGVVTLTHVGSVVLLGLVALLLSEFILPQQLYPWMGLASGCLIWLVGFWMLACRALCRGGQTHHHDHVHHEHHQHDDDHTHDHGHSHLPRGDVTLGSLLALGISGGMVPCPSALVVLLGAVALHRIGFGLALIFAFSLGLAAVLILIGVLAVKSMSFMTKGKSEARWVQVLPVLSSGIIMIAGVLIALNSLLAGGMIRTIF